MKLQFNANLEPYIATKKVEKFSGYFAGNKTVFTTNTEAGEVNYNPNDAKQGLPYSAAKGLLLAYCKATGEDITAVNLLLKLEEDKPAEEQPKNFIHADVLTDTSYQTELSGNIQKQLNMFKNIVLNLTKVTSPRIIRAYVEDGIDEAKER